MMTQLKPFMGSTLQAIVDGETLNVSDWYPENGLPFAALEYFPYIFGCTAVREIRHYWKTIKWPETEGAQTDVAYTQVILDKKAEIQYTLLLFPDHVYIPDLLEATARPYGEGTKNTVVFRMGAAAAIRHGVIYLPLLAVAEGFGYAADWDPREAVLTLKKQFAAVPSAENRPDIWDKGLDAGMISGFLLAGGIPEESWQESLTEGNRYGLIPYCEL